MGDRPCAEYSLNAVSVILIAVVFLSLAPITGHAVAINYDGTIFYVNHDGDFWRSGSPFSLSNGDLVMTQHYLNNRQVSESINVTNPVFSGYADLGASYGTKRPLGTLLAGFATRTITGTWPLSANITPLAVNLWFDVDRDGSIFQWTGADGCSGSESGSSCDRFTGIGADAYALGPTAIPDPLTTHRTIPLGPTSSFYMVGACPGSLTFEQLVGGACPGIDATTPTEMWLGTTAVSGDGGKRMSITSDPYPAQSQPGGGYAVQAPAGNTPIAAASDLLIVSAAVAASGVIYLLMARPKGKTRKWGIIITVAAVVAALAILLWPSMF